LDREQILREAEDGLTVVEADRRVVSANGEDVTLFAGSAEPLVKGAIAATDCDVAHVTGSTTKLRAATSSQRRPPKGLAEVAARR
jgi:hypothetical protein